MTSFYIAIREIRNVLKMLRELGQKNKSLIGHSGRKKIALFSLKKKLTDLKTNFTKFELSTRFCCLDITASISP